MDADNNIDYIVDFIINDSFSKDLKNKDIKDINDVELNKESNKLLITGSAGTGKTTLIINVLYKLVALQLLESFKLINIKILCLAMTHKALSIIKKYYKKHKDLESPNINITFSTIASFRNLRLDIETNKYLQVEQIKNDYYDVIIIDECSMVDNESYNDFNLYYKGKIIYIGDIHQLPPINQDESQAFQIINKINLDFTYRFGGDILHYANNILEPNFNIDKCYDTENITFFSQTLNRDVTFALYLPADYTTSQARYGTVYLLHGWGDNQTAWIKGGKVHTIINDLETKGTIDPYIYVMPNAS